MEEMMPKITRDTKIAVGLPRGKNGFDWTWIQRLLKMLNKYPAKYAFISEQAPHSVARNRITNRFLKTDADYILWIDSDTIWEEDDIQKLMDMDADMATGIQFACSEHHLPLIRKLDFKLGVYRPYHKLPVDGKPFEIDGCGFGFILIKRKVMEALKEPWFEFKSGFSEDLNFCLRTRRKGFKIVANPEVLVGHIGEKLYGLKDFLDIPESMRAAYVLKAMEGTNSYLRKLYPKWREDLGLNELGGKKELGENINLKKGYWDGVYEKELKDNFNWRTYPGKFPFISEKLLTGLPENAQVLELGAGLGILAEKVMKEHPEFIHTTMDISEYAVAHMKEKGMNAYEGTLPEWLSVVNDGVYDCVIGCDILEHLDDKPRLETVRESCRVLKNEGMAIFTVPNNKLPPSEIDEHRVCYNKESFESFLLGAFNGIIKVYEKDCLVSDVPRPDGLPWAKLPYLFGICIKDSGKVDTIA